MTDSFASHLALTVALLGFACAAAPGPSTAAGMSVQLACADDFYTYCSRHDPDSKGARQCMRVNGPKLSQGCIGALVAAGEVSKEEVARRASLRK